MVKFDGINLLDVWYEYALHLSAVSRVVKKMDVTSGSEL